MNEKKDPLRERKKEKDQKKREKKIAIQTKQTGGGGDTIENKSDWRQTENARMNSRITVFCF